MYNAIEEYLPQYLYLTIPLPDILSMNVNKEGTAPKNSTLFERMKCNKLFTI